MSVDVQHAASAPLPTGDIHRRVRGIAPYDFSLLVAVVLLLGLGAVMVYSATINEATLAGQDGSSQLKTHLAHIGVGIGALIATALFPYRRWQKLVYPSLLVVVILLGLVILIGTTAGFARRWIKLPGFSLQPAELAKLVFVLFLAYSLAKKAERIKEFAVAFVPHLLVCGLLILLCLFQPDFGTCIILVVLMFTMLFVAGTRLSYITLFATVGAFMGFQAIANNDMRLGRVLAFIDPWAYKSERGYQLVNSLTAIGSGDVFGQGIGYGGQTITGYLPEGHTDFILSVIAEQMGLVGVALVAMLFGVILYRGVKIALNASEDFGRYLAFGVTLLLTLQAVINMMVCVALIPTKGLTLPFVSYGGSSMVVCCAAMGILLNISRSQAVAQYRTLVPEPAPEADPGPAAGGGGKRAAKKKRKRRPKQQSLDEVLT